MFNFTSSGEAITTSAPSGMDSGTPSVKAFFGDWYVLATSD